jgi:hypothetical protein
MKATDFDLSKDLRLNPDTGIATFRNSRLVVMDASALGLLRHNVVDALGWEKARALFLRLGYSQGYSDFEQMKKSHAFDTEMDLLASGPVIHSWEGVVSARPKEVHFDRTSGEFYFSGVWRNSYEAEQYLCFNEPGKDAACWSLVGYASGWCTAFFGSPLVAIETKCVAKGDDVCEWVIRPPALQGPEASPVLEALRPLIGA